MAYACGGSASIPRCTATTTTGCGCVDGPDSGLVETERLASWGFDVQDNFLTNADNDCRTQNLVAAVFGTDADLGLAWQNALVVFAAQLFGCPPMPAGALKYGLLPPEPEQRSQVWTAADLAALNEDFVIAVEQALDGTGDAQLGYGAQPAPNTAGGVPFALTPAQKAELESTLAKLAAGVPAVNPSTTHYSFSVPVSSGCLIPDGG
jgi:hypothetical protein